MKYVAEMGVIVELEGVRVIGSGMMMMRTTSSWSHFVVVAERSKSFLVHYFESLQCTLVLCCCWRANNWHLYKLTLFASITLYYYMAHRYRNVESLRLLYGIVARIHFR